MTTTAASFADWHLRGEWRRYQELCLEAFERDRGADRPKTLLVAPPGSGKTVVGLEIVRRIGLPAVVLCPTQTIQRQWGARQELFGSVSPDLQLLTYQSLCQADDPDGMLLAAAERHWAHERAAATGQAPEAVDAEAATWTGTARERRERDLAKLVARFKRDAAAGRFEGLPADDLLSANARRRLAELIDAGVGTVVLDECHHLVSMWGALLKTAIAELEPRHVIGLTATNPNELTVDEAALYRELLDDVDFYIPTPAVVREGHLAPYQELVQIGEPLESERGWLAERHARFASLLDELDTVPVGGGEHLALSVWLLGRLRERRTADGSILSWTELARREPRLAEAGLRWLFARGEPPPHDAPRGERFRAPLGIDDWVELLEDYDLRCLRADASSEAVRRHDAMQSALGDLGFTLTRAGIRRTGGEVDRVLLSSAVKPLLMCDVLATEQESRGDALRAVVLCDTEYAPRQPADSPLLLTGGARGLLDAVAGDERLWPLHGALVTSETFAVRADDLGWWRERLAPLMAAAEIDATGLTSEPVGERVAALRNPDGRFDSARWTDWVTQLLGAGDCQLLIGTRGLLGEGWDCPQLNVLIDMTAVAADVSVRQMRGRSLRLDPGDPDKLANNWDIVCVAPDLERGHADYGRFIRRHAHLHAPCEDGAIETGPSHVHPELSPYGPPAAERFAAINAEQRERAQDRLAARQRWAVGTPYRGVDLDALAVRRPRRAPGATAVEAAALVAPPSRSLSRRFVAALVRRQEPLYPAELPLDWAAGCVCGAYVELGELTAEAARSLTFTPRPEGWVRVSIGAAEPATSQLVTAALDELVGGGALPRYVVSRLASPSGGGRPRRAWHGVPSDLARRKDRAEAFHRAWLRWCGKGALVYSHGDQPGARELAAQAAALPSAATQRRRIWL